MFCLLNVLNPCIIFTLTSLSTVSTGIRHLKDPSGKLAILSFQNFRVFIMLFCSVIYTVSCVPVAKVNHLIPCFSIRWKSKDSLFIKCLTLILSCSLITTILGKLIWLSLKVTVTSSNLSLACPICNFYLALCFQFLACL